MSKTPENVIPKKYEIFAVTGRGTRYGWRRRSKLHVQLDHLIIRETYSITTGPVFNTSAFAAGQTIIIY